MQPTLALVINAGGQSRRMGREKAMLPLPQPNSSGSNILIQHIAHRLASLPLERLVVVSGSEAVRAAVLQRRPPVPVLCCVADAYAGGGALGGLASGLRACPEWAAVVACDMPLLDPHLLHWQWQQIVRATHREVDAVVPVVGGREQPFHAMYHRRCLPAIEARLAAGERRVTSFLSDVRTHYLSEEETRRLDPQLRSFCNVNTPEEWAAVLPQLGAKQ